MRIARYDDGSCSLFSDDSELLMSLSEPFTGNMGIEQCTGSVDIEALYSLMFVRVLEKDYSSIFKSLTNMLTSMLLDAYNSEVERR